MSMSQEEIESLMNGLDIQEDEKSEEAEVQEEIKEEAQSMSEEDIEALIAQTNLENSNNDEKVEEKVEDKVEKNMDNDSIDDLLKELEDSDKTTVENDSIDDLIENIENENKEELTNNETFIDESDNLSLDSTDNEQVDTSDIDELLENLKTNDESSDDYLKELDNIELNNEVNSLKDIDAKVNDTVEENASEESFQNVVSIDKINIPNQLGEVANDSEEKATKIFDVLSYILDDNAALRKTVKGLDSFIQSQQKMLETLNRKFPNVKEFSENLELVNSLNNMPKEINERLLNRDNELFEAMELMQFHDINRQKIERVMRVVVDLSRQLNSIFDDSTGSATSVPISKHLPGDSTQDVVGGDDLESLIAEFGK